MLRLAALLARIEARHWVGLGASVALHLAVILGLRQAPPPEPAPVSFEIALEAPKPEAVARKKSRIVADTGKHKSKKTAARRKPLKREPHTLEAAWRSESTPPRDVPQVALPDARALGVEAPVEKAAPLGEHPRLTPTVATVVATPVAIAGRGPAALPAKAHEAPGLSEPGQPGSSVAPMPAPGGEAGMALASTPTLAMNPAPGAGAVGVDAATSLAAASHPGADHLNASLNHGTSPNPATGIGAQSSSASPAPAQAGGEPQGIRLAASGALSLRPELPAGAGSLESAPVSVDAGRAAPAQADGGGTALASTQAGGSASVPPSLARESGDAGGAGSDQVVSQGGSAQETPERLAGIGKMTTTLSGSPIQATRPATTPQAGRALALAPGEPGSSPGLAVAMQTVTATPPTQAGRDGSRLGKFAYGAEAGGAAEPATAGANRAGEPGRPVPLATAPVAASRAGANAGGGMAMATPSLPGGESRSGPGPDTLQAVKTEAVQVMRPDSRAQPLDVLAPSTYCPLPLPGHGFPDNRAPKPANDSTEQPGYAQNNPNFFYPIQAWAYSVEGHVTVRVEVLPDGSPGKMWVKLSSGNGILDRDAQSQLSHWRFTPARKHGQAVTAWIDIPVVYRLQEAKK